MNIMKWFRRDTIEKRAVAAGFTSEIVAARDSFFRGERGVAELTGIAESAIGLWERTLAGADVSEEARPVLSPMMLGLIGRSLALRGEFVALVDVSDGDRKLITAYDWDISTRRGVPTAYRLSLPDAGGGDTVSALAREVVHIRINLDSVTPWAGSSPLRRARLTGDMLAAIEQGLGNVFAGTWGSLVLPSPEMDAVQRAALERGIKGSQGNALVVKSAKVAQGAQTAPVNDWKPEQISPNIEGIRSVEHWQGAKDAILSAFGIPPLMFSSGAQSAALREAQRFFGLSTMAPIARVAAAELGEKLGMEIGLDTVSPSQSADAAGRARAVLALVNAGSDLQDALSRVGWDAAG